MRRNIDFDKVDDINIYALKQLIKLKSSQKQILIDIGKIEEGYKGIDAKILINKYTGRVYALNTYIDYVEKYCKFLGWLSNGYGEAYNKAKQQLDTMMLEPKEEIIDKMNIKFDMKNILTK
jgi:hypothetical protein